MSTHRPVHGLFVPLCVLFGLAALAAQWRSWVLAGDAARATPTDMPAATSPGDARLQVRREGTPLRDEPGRFTLSGNRVAFNASDGTTYIGLENLNLQRVAKAVAASPEVIEWFVTGTLTEYQGSNYLLVTHVRRKSAMPKPPRGF
ncbi:MAG TPA: hypothetical protein VG826_02715 [Pirellulales bacterium]|nr:hypothetical protein [Pirellulales bacterium]